MNIANQNKLPRRARSAHVRACVDKRLSDNRSEALRYDCSTMRQGYSHIGDDNRGRSEHVATIGVVLVIAVGTVAIAADEKVRTAIFVGT